MGNLFRRVSGLICYSVVLSGLILSSNAQATTGLANPTLVNTGTAPQAGNFYTADNSAVSDNGRYVFFFGTYYLSGNSGAASRQLVKRDMATGAVEFVNVNNTGQFANNTVTRPGISADGRYAVFTSTANNLVPNDTNGVSDVFVRDTINDTTTRVSTTSDGSQLSAASAGDEITDNGQFVAFSSSANNLVPNDTNGVSDVFKKSLITGEVARVSLNNQGNQSSCTFYSSCNTSGPVMADKGMSGDGRFILFNTSASNFSGSTYTGDASGSLGSFGYIRDTQNNTTTLVSLSYNGSRPFPTNQAMTFSDDGRYVVTVCNYVNGCRVTADDTTSGASYFLVDTQTGNISRVSDNSSSERPNGLTTNVLLSDDGKTLTFSSLATNLVANDTNGVYDIFSRNLVNGEIMRVSVKHDGTQSNSGSTFPAMSSDGRFVTFNGAGLNSSSTVNSGVYLYDRLPAPLAPTQLTATSPTNESPSLSWQASQNAEYYKVYRDGQYLAPSTETQFEDDNAPEGVSSYTVSAVNSAGESPQSSSVSVLVDRTDPTITYTIVEMPNNFDWNKSGVTVTFNCSDSDGGSGVDNCSSPVNFLDDGEGQTAVGTVTDNAGNSASVTATVNIDSALPTISSFVSPSANSLGWHSSDPTISFECADALSGLNTCTEPIIVSGETGGQDVNGAASDKAGNEATVAKTIKLDKTAPVIAAPTWTTNPKPTNGTATMSLAVTESLSGLSEAEYFLGDTDPGIGNGATMQTSNTDGALVASTTFNTDFPTGVYKVSVRAKDVADNWGAVTTDYLVVYNPVGPRMTGKQTILPSLSNGDLLPGLNSGTQTDTAKFGFSVKYDSQQQISANSDFQFSYNTGTHCNSTKPNNPPQNCHQLELNSSSISWLTTQGQNGSEGIFQGAGTLIVDGVSQQVAFRVTGIDGERLDASSLDRFALSIFALGDNPSSATPIYKVAATNITRGNVKIMDQ